MSDAEAPGSPVDEMSDDPDGSLEADPVVEMADVLGQIVDDGYGYSGERVGAGSVAPEVVDEQLPLPSLVDAPPETRAAAPTNEMVDSYYLIQAGRKRRTVARLVATADPSVTIGTGFLVGPSLLMTCQHTLASAANAAYVSAQFDYLDVPGDAGEGMRAHMHRLRPDVFFHNERRHDYAVVFVEPISDRGQHVLDRRWNQLHEDRWYLHDGDPVNIVQHPIGDPKNPACQKIAFRRNKSRYLPWRDRRFLHYFADTQIYSSGAPVWNDRWKLVGLHHGFVRLAPWSRSRRLVNQGVRMNEIAGSFWDELKRRDREQAPSRDCTELARWCFKSPTKPEGEQDRHEQDETLGALIDGVLGVSAGPAGCLDDA